MKDNTVKRTKKPGITGIIMTVITLALAGLIYLGSIETHYLMFPLIIFLSFVLVSKIVAFIFTGSFVKILCSSLMWLAVGISVSLLFVNAQGGQNIRSAGIYILLIPIIAVFYRIMMFAASGRLSLQAVMKILFAICFAFLIRNLIISILGNAYLTLIDWLILSLLCIVLFYILMKLVKSIVRQIPSKEWKKHRQSVEQNPGKELPEISSYIDIFIEGNDKKSILIAVIEEGLGRKLTYKQIDTIINDFINYRDEPVPVIITRWQKRKIEIDNRTKRENVLVDMIKKLKETDNSVKL